MLSTILEIALRTLIIYFVVLTGIRITGKREVGQMTPFDLVLLLLIANAVQNAMTGPDTTVYGGITAAATLLILNAIVSRITYRSKKIQRFIEGTPTLLIHDGKLLTENLKKEQLTQEEIYQALREHGVGTIEEVKTGLLEIDGSISVLKMDEMPVEPRSHHHIRFLNKNKN